MWMSKYGCLWFKIKSMIIFMVSTRPKALPMFTRLRTVCHSAGASCGLKGPSLAESSAELLVPLLRYPIGL